MKGFTLIEILVVMAITVVMAGLLVTNFNRSSVDLTQTRTLVQDAIREAQSLALSGSLYGGSYRCGYGVTFDEKQYTVYAGPDAEAEGTVCNEKDRRYDDEDVRVRTGFISNKDITIRGAKDIFFEPPRPTTYIDGSSDPDSIDIEIVKGDAECQTVDGQKVSSSDCRIINVTTSGLITAR